MRPERGFKGPAGLGSTSPPRASLTNAPGPRPTALSQEMTSQTGNSSNKTSKRCKKADKWQSHLRLTEAPVPDQLAERTVQN